MTCSRKYVCKGGVVGQNPAIFLIRYLGIKGKNNGGGEALIPTYNYVDLVQINDTYQNSGGLLRAPQRASAANPNPTFKYQFLHSSPEN